MAGINEIAKKANVSKTAVSFALNNKSGISQETRKRIIKIAKELDFKHRKKADKSTKLAGNIGFIKVASHGHIVNRDHDVFIADYIYGINKECKRHGYNFTLFDFQTVDIDTLNTTDLQNCSGLIILGTELSKEDIINISRSNIPIVFIDTYLDFLPYNFVTMNNKDAIFSILKLLKETNHTDIKMVTTEVECTNIKEREASYFEAMDFLGLNYDTQSLIRFDSTYLGAYNGMMKLLNSQKKRPQAFVCANDIIALGCIKAIKEHGIHIPNDISITGFDDLPGSAMMDPALTSYQVPKEEIGKIGFQILIKAIDQQACGFSTIKTRVDGELVKRDTVKNYS